MNKQMMTRLDRLEGVSAGASFLIIRQIVDADGREREPEAFIDGRGNSWRRATGETLETFRERAGADAMMMAGSGTARLVPVEG